MSRLSFDEILDFIIEANAERVELLFRRPKKEDKVGISSSNMNPTRGIKWADEEKDNVPTKSSHSHSRNSSLDRSESKSRSSRDGSSKREKESSSRRRRRRVADDEMTDDGQNIANE